MSFAILKYKISLVSVHFFTTRPIYFIIGEQVSELETYRGVQMEIVDYSMYVNEKQASVRMLIMHRCQFICHLIGRIWYVCRLKSGY